MSFVASTIFSYRVRRGSAGTTASWLSVHWRRDCRTYVNRLLLFLLCDGVFFFYSGLLARSLALQTKSRLFDVGTRKDRQKTGEPAKVLVGKES